ncbi:DUF2500 domain-containing protein [Streptococcus himalayensis]|uniref:Membrane protein n=1 Tax=Streptococcus himalayensis TaxID=1888195 RepID=A0A917EGK1_9STRE|nr:DUF2500 domain-containing protein [Streptococcus himalayensis]GGE31602.1 membrane protein [Streptococcus himalayensis]
MESYSHYPGAILLVGLFLLGLAWIILKSAKEEFKNNAAPKEEYAARLVGKRTYLGRGRYASTTYYLTFEWNQGERREFCVDGEVYGLLAEGDVGDLIFQGTRLIDFRRN